MPYRVALYPSVRRAIRRWGLSDGLLVDVHMRLHRDWLGTDPSRYLLDDRDPEGGMVFKFSLVDAENRLLEHGFTFRVLYGQDEETLWVFRGSRLQTGV